MRLLGEERIVEQRSDLEGLQCLAFAMNILHGCVRWVLVAWMLVISAVSYLDRVDISIAGPSIEHEFWLDHIRLGWVFSAWVLGYATTASLTPFVAKHFGWNMSFWVAAGLCFLGGLAWLLVDPNQQLTAVPKRKG